MSLEPNYIYIYIYRERERERERAREVQVTHFLSHRFLKDLTVGFSKYEFNNKLLSGVTLLRVTLGVT